MRFSPPQRTREKREKGGILRLGLTVAVLVFFSLMPALSNSPLHLTFTHLNGEQPLLSDSLRYQNDAGETYSSTRLSYLLSDITLHGNDGTTSIKLKDIGFIDATRARLSITNVPHGNYTSVSFSIGPNKKINHSNPAQYTAKHPLNPNLNNLHWDWQGGYIFMAIEGHWRKPGAKFPNGYAYHFANDANRTHVILKAPIKITGETNLIIALDLGKLLKGLSFTKDGATTHSQAGDPVAARLRSNIASAFRILSVAATRQMPPQPPAKPIDLPSKFTPYPITLPKHVPIPALPLDNPLIKERVILGEKLFSETKFSRTNSISCASCHQGKTFSDPRQFSLGVDGNKGTRHSMPLFNLAWKKSLFWDGRASSLRKQALIPIQDHLEMDESLENVVAKIKAEPSYPPLFAAAFASGEITPENIGLAIENFLLSRLSLDSKLDRSVKGKATLTPEEKRGFELFFTEFEPRLGKYGADCFHCHGGALFTDHSFHNNGLTNTQDIGLAAFTGKGSDRYKFSTPSLRNIALTAPYMHDGRFATLEEVIDHYSGGFMRSETLDPNLAKHPTGLKLKESDKRALIAFLKTLTDPSMVEKANR
ncbi:MAG: MbnP family protein [Akkermansiaceae bacterium]